MSTIERLAKMAQETTPDQWVSIFSELHEQIVDLEQQLEAAERREKGLVEALRRIAYMQQDICSPPIMSEAESIRRKAVAALAAHSAQEI